MKGWIINPPLMRIDFIDMPATGKTPGGKRIVLQPGNVMIETALEALPIEEQPKKPWLVRWGRGIYTPHTARLVLGLLFGREIGEEYAGDFHYQVLSQRKGTFMMSSGDILRWLMDHWWERSSCLTLRYNDSLLQDGEKILDVGLIDWLERAVKGKEGRYECADPSMGPIREIKIDLHLTPGTLAQLGSGKMDCQDIPDLVDGIERAIRTGRGGYYGEQRMEWLKPVSVR